VTWCYLFGDVPKADVPAAPLPSVNQTLGEAYLGLIPDRDRYNEEVSHSTFSRTARRLCGGAKGLAVWCYLTFGRCNGEVALAGLAPIVAWLELAREDSAGDAFNAIVEQRRLAGVG
jgi:hypothetical protein